MWSTVWRLDTESTPRHAQRENPSRDLADLVLLGAAVARLVAVGVVLFGAGHAAGNMKYVQAEPTGQVTTAVNALDEWSAQM
jgi:hypothetical protein